MDHPGRGTPFSIRSLAKESCVNRSTIGHLLTGERDDIEMDDAHAVTEALGVAVLVLFMPPSSPNPIESTADPYALKEIA
jgi:hypothetical protein